jgi:hypothetical protein
MSEDLNDGLGPAALDALNGERVEVVVHAEGAEMVVTAHRLLVTLNGAVVFALPIQELRRIQYDIEANRPAVLAIVPERAEYEPQLLTVLPESFENVARALTLVGRTLAASRGIGVRESV